MVQGLVRQRSLDVSRELRNLNAGASLFGRLLQERHSPLELFPHQPGAFDEIFKQFPEGCKHLPHVGVPVAGILLQAGLQNRPKAERKIGKRLDGADFGVMQATLQCVWTLPAVERVDGSQQFVEDDPG